MRRSICGAAAPVPTGRGRETARFRCRPMPGPGLDSPAIRIGREISHRRVRNSRPQYRSAPGTMGFSPRCVRQPGKWRSPSRVPDGIRVCGRGSARDAVARSHQTVHAFASYRATCESSVITLSRSSGSGALNAFGSWTRPARAPRTRCGRCSSIATKRATGEPARAMTTSPPASTSSISCERRVLAS